MAPDRGRKARMARAARRARCCGALTAAMKLDLLLFGHVESGPFFALLERTPSRQPTTSDLRPPILR